MPFFAQKSLFSFLVFFISFILISREFSSSKITENAKFSNKYVWANWRIYLKFFFYYYFLFLFYLFHYEPQITVFVPFPSKKYNVNTVIKAVSSTLSVPKRKENIA